MGNDTTEPVEKMRIFKPEITKEGTLDQAITNTRDAVTKESTLQGFQ
jgi:hypothetical protein